MRRHDTLWAIAERLLHDPLRYPEIVRLNPAGVGPDNEITPGAVLTLPADASGLPTESTSAPAGSSDEVAVAVRPGDTLWSIEERLTGFGANWTQAWQTNRGRAEPDGRRFDDPNLIVPGYHLSIPVSGRPAHPGQPPRDPVSSERDRRPPGAAKQLAQPADPATPTQPEPSPQADRAGQGQARPAAVQRPGTDMTVFAGGGGLLLGGVSLTALLYYRRRQSQSRRPGRMVAGIPEQLVPIEKELRTAGCDGLADVTWLDHALRGLAYSAAEHADGRLPDVTAACMSDDELTLILVEPEPSAPQLWRVDATGTRWSLRRDDELGYDAGRRAYHFAPYPALTSIGYTNTGERWLLDLERIGSLSLTGDADRCLNLARFLAAELAHNSWSEMLHVTLAGFGAELVEANPDRIAHSDDLAGAVGIFDKHHAAVRETMRTADVDVLTGRLRDIVGDQWAPNVLVIAPDLAADVNDLDTLLASMNETDARACTAVVLVGDRDGASDASRTRWQMHLDRDGTLSIPALGLELVAQQLPADEAAPLAQMLALATLSGDVPIPPARGQQPWDAYADACGNLIPTRPHVNDDHASRADAVAVPDLRRADVASTATNSALPLATQVYLERAATGEQDLQTLAPNVGEEVRAEIEQADPNLDDDLAGWYDANCARPKLTLLGPVHVQAQGELPRQSPQRAFHTEIVVRLATRPDGMPSNVFAETMWPNDPDAAGKSKVRQAIGVVRAWLGCDPLTGEQYLPSGLHDAGRARYRIVGALVDAELFRRLRIRAQSRGADGLADLWRALELVQGPPFAENTEPRKGSPGGYTWLTEANSRLDSEYAVMIVDTAHTVATHHLGADEPALAAKAAHVALKAGSYEDTPLLDLVQASWRQNRPAEGEAYVAQILFNHDAEVEEDLLPRTAEILFRLRRQWSQVG